MLGGFRKTIIGGSTLGLIAVGLASNPAAVQAVPQKCTIVTTAAQVGADEPAPGQVTFGPQWNDVVTNAARPRYGLYYPPTDPSTDPVRGTPTDPAANKVIPRVENFGGGGTLPATPVQTGRNFQWRLNGTCFDRPATFTSSGHAIGYCGRSVGMGKGKVKENGVEREYIVRWESLGSQLHLLDPSAVGSVNAQPNPAGSPNGSCTDGTAIVFTVSGAIVDTTA